MAGGLDFKVVKEVLKKVEDGMFKKAMFSATMKIISSNPSSRSVLDSHASDIEACESLI